MKTVNSLFKATLIITFLFSAQTTIAQCVRSGSFVQSDPAYVISGTGNITYETNGDKNVVFESDFATVQGADLQVYLSKTGDILNSGSDAIQVSTIQLMNDGGGTGGAGVSPITGMKSFTIPASVTIDEFDYIVIQCIAINERWGHVTLGANTGGDCPTILSVEDNFLDQNIRIYPNPATDRLQLNNSTSKKVQVKMYSMLGNLIFEKDIHNPTAIIDLSNIKSGVYLVDLISDNARITKKIIKQ